MRELLLQCLVVALLVGLASVDREGTGSGGVAAVEAAYPNLGGVSGVRVALAGIHQRHLVATPALSHSDRHSVAGVTLVIGAGSLNDLAVVRRGPVCTVSLVHARNSNAAIPRRQASPVDFVTTGNYYA